MPIRSEEELANIIGLSLQSYANRVLNGAVQPFLGLLKESTVEVTFVVTEEGGFAVKREPIDSNTLTRFNEIFARASVRAEEYSTPEAELPKIPILEEAPKLVKPKRTRKKKEKPVENPSPISA